MKLNKLEQDLIEDLAQDTHGIWEVLTSPQSLYHVLC